MSGHAALKEMVWVWERSPTETGVIRSRGR